MHELVELKRNSVSKETLFDIKSFAPMKKVEKTTRVKTKMKKGESFYDCHFDEELNKSSELQESVATSKAPGVDLKKIEEMERDFEIDILKQEIKEMLTEKVGTEQSKSSSNIKSSESAASKLKMVKTRVDRPRTKIIEIDKV